MRLKRKEGQKDISLGDVVENRLQRGHNRLK